MAATPLVVPLWFDVDCVDDGRVQEEGIAGVNEEPCLLELGFQLLTEALQNSAWADGRPAENRGRFRLAHAI